MLEINLIIFFWVDFIKLTNNLNFLISLKNNQKNIKIFKKKLNKITSTSFLTETKAKRPRTVIS